jgi:hypothetical protein
MDYPLLLGIGVAFALLFLLALGAAGLALFLAGSFLYSSHRCVKRGMKS